MQGLRSFEAAGQLPEALRQYKIALTVRPNDRAAKEGRERVEKALRKGAEEHYRAGLRMQKEGKQAQALQQLSDGFEIVAGLSGSLADGLRQEDRFLLRNRWSRRFSPNLRSKSRLRN